MPPKRRNNKKNKNKGRAGHGRSSRKQAQTPARAAETAAKGSNDVTMSGKEPTHWQKLKDRKNELGEEFPTMYSRYKNATKRFIEYMTEACPSEMGEGSTANSLSASADWMEGTGHVIEKSVLKDLKLSIRCRNQVAKSIYGGGDAGHKYFLEVLRYCWFVLNKLPKTVEKKDESKPQKEEKEEANHFAALMEDDDSDDEDATEEEEKIFPSSPVPRPSSSGPVLSLDELLNSDDRHDIILFLNTLDEIMGGLVLHYKTSVMKNFIYYQRIGYPASAIVEELIEASVATNMAIQQVQKLEMDLMFQHKHLTTPYRLLATLVLPEITHDIAATVREHAAKEGCSEKDITIYLGDCMECCFRNDSDVYNQKDTITKDFCRKWQLDSIGATELERLHMGLCLMVENEIPVATEKKEVARRQMQYKELPGTHSWIQRMPYIGGDNKRSIHKTMRLLQMFGDVIKRTPENRGLEAKRGFFDKLPWVPGRSRTIDDLDELLMADILPKWVLMCRKGVIGITNLPMEDELCPLFVVIRKYVKEPEKPVNWSIAFAIHALLTAVLEVDPVFDELASASKQVFDNYFSQLEWTNRLAKNNPESIGDPNSTAGDTWWRNTISISFLSNLGLPVFGERTLWNPLCAGTILSYLTYFGNLEGGCALIDCHAQLRITLHLYHALMVNGIIRKGQIEMLDRLFDCFRNSKAIWGGRHLPKRGEFVHRFWICFGNNIADSKRMVKEAKQTFQGREQANQSANTPRGGRKLVPIEPAEISKSYRRICNRDFHDVVDKYHTPEQRSRCKGSDQYLLMCRINDTCDAIDEEQKLLALNLPSCAVFLEQFVNSLGRVMQWETFLTHFIRSTEGLNDIRDGFVYIFAQYLLGALDFADDPLSHEFMQTPLGLASSQFMTEFFNRIDVARAIWFQAAET